MLTQGSRQALLSLCPKSWDLMNFAIREHDSSIFARNFPAISQGQVSTGILHLVNLNLGSNSGMRIFEPRVLGPNPGVKYFGPIFFQ